MPCFRVFLGILLWVNYAVSIMPLILPWVEVYTTTRHETGRRHGPPFFCQLVFCSTVPISAAGGVRTFLYPALHCTALHCPSSISRLVLLGILGAGLVLCSAAHCHFPIYHLESLSISHGTRWRRLMIGSVCLLLSSSPYGSPGVEMERQRPHGPRGAARVDWMPCTRAWKLKTSQPHVTLPFQLLLLGSTLIRAFLFCT